MASHDGSTNDEALQAQPADPYLVQYRLFAPEQTGVVPLREFVHEHQLLSGFIGAIVGALIIGAATLIASSSGSSPSGSPSSIPTSSTGTQGPKPPPSPAKPVFLSTLTEEGKVGGDRPQPGEIQLGGREMPNSVFFEKIENASAAQVCNGEPYGCRAVTYELKERYRSLSGTFGFIETSSYDVQAHWQVLVNNRMARQGKIQPGVTVPLAVPLHNGKTLELRVILEGAFSSATTDVVWGEAQLEP